MDKLKVTLNNKEILVKEIPEGNTIISLGRHSECDILLPGSGVSRKHAQVLSANGQFFIEDLNSTAGTLLNGNKISEMTPFSPDDVIRIGEYNDAGLLCRRPDLCNHFFPEGCPPGFYRPAVKILLQILGIMSAFHDDHFRNPLHFTSSRRRRS